MSLTHEQAAQRLGMAVREVIDVVETDAGHVVTTHDDQRVLVTDDAVLPYTAAVLVGEHGPELATEAASAEDVAALHAKLQAAGDDEGQELVVPQGTADQVMEWVCDDPARAAAALKAEQAANSPRSGLIGRLEKLVTP
jgi:hypothetical protein